MMARMDNPSAPLLIVGVDEVGRGCLAGPVVAAAVVLARPLDGLDDSKKLTARRREALVAPIHAASSHLAIGQASPAEIDEINILQATFLAMQRAVQSLGIDPQQAILHIDGNLVPGWCGPGGFRARAIIGGDGTDPAISAASIIAKQFRDHLMADLDAQYPGYGLAKHMGYGTAQHLKALGKMGPSPIHRMSFAPVRLASGNA